MHAGIARVPRRRKLEFGRSPWDHMGRPELLREVQRMFVALQSCRGALNMNKTMDPSSPYWGSHGTGGSALARAEMAMVTAAQFTEESLYRSFFRYAADLLFTPAMGHGWAVCLQCDVMLGDERTDMTTRPCGMCGGQMRWLNWSDLDPKPAPIEHVAGSVRDPNGYR